MNISGRLEEDRSSSSFEKMPSPCTEHAKDTKSDKKKTKSKKSVHFAASVQVHAVEALDDYSEREICNMWYGEEDLMAIREDCIETVRRMVHKSTIDPTVYCTRGLENKTPDGLKKRQQNNPGSYRLV